MKSFDHLYTVNIDAIIKTWSKKLVKILNCYISFDMRTHTGARRSLKKIRTWFRTPSHTWDLFCEIYPGVLHISLGARPVSTGCHPRKLLSSSNHRSVQNSKEVFCFFKGFTRCHRLKSCTCVQCTSFHIPEDGSRSSAAETSIKVSTPYFYPNDGKCSILRNCFPLLASLVDSPVDQPSIYLYSS